MVAIAATKYCCGVKHIPVVSFVSSRVDSLVFERSSGISKRGTSLNHRAVSEVFALFLDADISDN